MGGLGAFVCGTLPVFSRGGRSSVSRVHMCERDSSNSSPKETPQRRRAFVSAAVGRAAQADSIAFADCSAEAVAVACAEGVVDAILQTYSKDDYESVFVICGPGFNGLVGAHSAILLRQKGYAPTVYRLEGVVDVGGAGRESPLDVCALIREHDIPLCDFAPKTLDFYYDVVVDALLGLGFDGGDVRSQYWNVFDRMVHTELPILSIDIPSGWDLDGGPRKVDVMANTFLQPEVLVSLGVPKNGSKVFAGAFHFVGGRHLPPTWAESNGVDLPSYRGEDSPLALFSSNAFGATRNGEVYGKPGKFEATLWDNKSRRKWISDEEMTEMDLWDELD